MGCGDTCPVFPGKRYLDWKLEDPAGQGVEAVRPIRDEIKARIEALIAEIAPEPPRMTHRRHTRGHRHRLRPRRIHRRALHRPRLS